MSHEHVLSAVSIYSEFFIKAAHQFSDVYSLYIVTDY